MQDYAHQQRQPHRHALGIALVLALHVLLFWVIQSGLSREVTKKIQVVADVLLLSQDKPPPPALPPPPPKTVPSPPRMAPAPQLPLAEAPVVETPSSGAVMTAPLAPASASASASASAAAAAAAAAASPAIRSEPIRRAAVAISCQKPEYPRVSVRMEEEGVVTLKYVVGIEGGVTKVDVIKSSGYKRLDNAAAQQILQKWRFKPATIDGIPIEQTFTSTMTFLLNIESQSAKDESPAC
ncbi:MAG: energy transducer TonB [Nevskiaceae bacterium]|nr:MAG: energy transducer TonB [Nevskiaceae bacterium]